MDNTKEAQILKDISKNISDLHGLAQFKEYGLAKEHALKQLNAITQNIKTNFTEFIESQ